MIKTLDLLRGGPGQPLSLTSPLALWHRARLSLAAWRQRRALGSLDPALLEDIGISREAAETEAARPFWDVPQHWLDR